MVVSVCKAIIKRSVEYQRRGLRVLRHAVTLVLGLGLASTILYISGDNPFAPTIAVATAGEIVEQALDTAAQVAAWTNPINVLAMLNSILGGVIVATLGIVLTLFVWLANYVASYDVVINTPNVILAWRVLRDLVNLFFVIILLIIAIGTTLRREQYMWNKNLPRFIIAVIFVNFSRTIVAFVTDFADVIQQTFVAGIDSVGFSTFISMLGVIFYPTISQVQDFSTLPDPGQVLASLALVAIMELIVMAIMFVYIVMFVGRVVMLWLLAIFGPLAFVSSILPQTQKYYKDWWSKLSQAAILGPMLAFFMWLAITIVPSPAEASFAFGVFSGAPPQFGTAAQPSFVIGWLIAVIILYFGMQQGMGMAGDFGSFVGKAQSFAFGTVLGGMAGLAKGAAKGVGGFGLKKADDYFTAGRKLVGSGIQSRFKGKIGQTLGGVVGAGGTIRTMAAGFKQSRDEANKENDLRNQNLNAGAVTAMTTAPQRLFATITQPTVERGAQIKNATSILDEAAASIEDDKAGEATEKIDEAKLILKDTNLTLQDKAKIQDRIDELEQLNSPGAEAAKIKSDIVKYQKALDEVKQKVRDIEEDATLTDAQKATQLQPLQRQQTALENRILTGNSNIEIGERKRNIAKGLVGRARRKNEELYQEGVALQAGARKVGPIDLSNVTREAVMRNANAEKVNREAARKRVQDLAFGEDKNVETATLESMQSGDHAGTLAGVASLIELGKLMDLYKSGNGRKILERSLTELYKAKKFDKNQIEAALEKFRQQPGSPEYTAAALEGLTLLTSKGDEGLAADQLAQLQSLAVAAHGSQAGGMTYTEMSTGNTKIIPVKVDSDGGISFEEKAKKAKVAGLKRATPEKILNNWQVTTVVNNNANGDPSAMSATFKDQLKYLTGMGDDQARKFIPADVKLVLRKIENQEMAKVFRKNLESKELQENFDMVMRAIKPKQTQNTPAPVPDDEDED